jgi:hypothetical protein
MYSDKKWVSGCVEQDYMERRGTANGHKFFYGIMKMF